MNPANLKWQYILEDIQKSSSSVTLKAKVNMCLSSLSKFPLVLPDLSHCKMLKHFDQEIYSMMSNTIEDAKKEEIDVVGKSSIESKSESFSKEMDYDRGSSNPVFGENSPTQELKISQEEADYQMALRLSMEDSDVESELSLLSLPEISRTSISHSVTSFTSQSKIVISSPGLEETLESDDDPFDLEKPQKIRRPPKTKKPVYPKAKHSDDGVGKVSKKRKLSEKKSDVPSGVDDETDPLINDVPENLTQNQSRPDKYRPKPGSAGYAILIALYREEKSLQYQGFVTKTELCKLAQPFTETNLKHSYAGTTGPQSWYSGWSSASTLIKKGLIETWSNPLKVKLTEKGKEIGASLSLTRDSAEVVDNKRENQTGNSVFSEASWLNDCSLGENSNKTAEDFQFCYISSAGRETNNQDLADIHIDGAVFYMVKCYKKALEQSGKLYKLVTPTVEGQAGLCIAYLEEGCCPETGCLSSMSFPPSTAKPESSVHHSVESVLPSELISKNYQTLDDDLELEDLPENWIIDDQDREDELRAPTVSSSSDTFVLKSGSYEIVLIVDAMEVTGGAHGGKKSRKVFTLEELEQNKVNYDCRKLNIGDFIWVAREKDKNDFRELVLPYIVERKRMDDLRASIMDGRYHEQKTRLKLSGVRTKLYLVEEACLKFFSSANGPRALDKNTLEQAITNTCSRDGFRICRTKTQKETCKFLTSFTKILNKKYQGVDLQSCTYDETKVIKSWETSLMTFKDFNERSRPDKALSIREIFSNMLICQKGLSSGMAWAITEKYPTPSSLKSAYDKCEEGEDEKLLSGITYEKGKKKIPSSISKTVALIFKETHLN